jgi:hypothetical protein
MSTQPKTIRIFYMPQQFPCGPESSCCGPVGQSYEEIQTLKAALEKEFDATVDLRNAMNGSDMKEHLQVLRLIRSLGPMALPVVMIGEEAVSVGSSAPEEVIAAIKEKISVH